jgi:hypothetical protein
MEKGGDNGTADGKARAAGNRFIPAVWISGVP